ncbi:MAG TPA: TolC family protein [Nevskiales bacterium]|nr:TolC family protein [Nevskiales bacterium]
MLFAHTRAACASFLFLGLLVCTAARAEAPPAGPPLSLREAVQLTLQRNPDLQVFAFALRAQDARTQQAGLRPPPELSAEIENALGSGETKGFDTAEATFALSQVIELGGKRSRRIAASQLGREALSVEQQAAQLDVLAEVTRRFVHVASDQEQLALTRRATELTRTTVAAVQRRVEAAKSPDVELYRARASLTRAEIDLRHAEHELLASRRKLAAMWGEREARFGTVEADLYAMPAPTPYEQLVARMAANPDFVRFASEARLRDAEIRLAEARRRPDVTLTGGIRRLQETSDTAFVVGFSVPLFAGRQAAPAIAEAQALRGQTDAEREAAFVKAQAQVYELYQELAHAINETGTLKQDVLPQMEEALKQTEYAYDRGRYSYLELVDGQRAYLDSQRALIEAATTAQTLQAEIERLTGEPLAAGAY